MSWRLHAEFLHRPSTLRLSSVNPNLTNVVSDKSGKETLASEFRHVIVPAKGCRLAEVDFAGIEAVLTGWFMADPAYIRLAKLGVHAFLTSHVVNRPANLLWSDDDLAGYFKEIKKAEPFAYNACKTVVHGRNYLRTAHGLNRDLPDVFPTIRSAETLLAVYDRLCPKLSAWQQRTLRTAGELHYVGGAVSRTLRDGTITQCHPYAYKHWFWAVYAFSPITTGRVKTLEEARKAGKRVNDVIWLNHRPFLMKLGDDAKRAAAFFPQSTAAAILKEVGLTLFHPESPDYVGDAYYGDTPLRAPIHDSLLLEIPDACWDETMHKVLRVMTRAIPTLPIPPEWRQIVPTLGTHLSIGVEAKWSDQSWGEMETLKLEDYVDLATEARPAPTPTAAQVEAMPIVQDGWVAPEGGDEAEEEEREGLAREVTL